jgi:alpha-galactosidase
LEEEKIMHKVLSEYSFSDMSIRYLVNEDGNTGFEVLPAGLKSKAVASKKYNIDPLVQVFARGDDFSGGFANGHTMRNGKQTFLFKYESQKVQTIEDAKVITTILKNEQGHVAKHILTFHNGLKAFEVKTVFANESDKAICLELISSFSVGGLTPFIEGEAPESMNIHRIRSCWSNEGRVITETVEDLQLEPSWSGHGVRTEKFGQVGSMPVRKFFPFLAVEDTVTNVVWAVQLACASSWQMELYRRDDALCISGGLADYDFGHWMKVLKPKDQFETPSAYITVAAGNVDEASQRLLTIQNYNLNKLNKFDKLPLLFNEFCTTWGNPSHDNIKKIVDIVKDKGVDYFVIDSGWFADKDYGWDGTHGDWIVSQEVFPHGLQETVNIIKESGMIPGIWFEFENCGFLSKAYQDDKHLLKRNGNVITSGVRRFWDMTDPWVIDYLSEKVISMLKQYGFKYLKVDYNETIGIGCDGYESLGEGLRQRILASQAFFAKIREEIPDIIIENFSSGGHRLEPSMMSLCEMASFSDAHECNEIPVIAANLHRVINPCQSQIWAVLRKDDSKKRTVYSIINTFLGVMCLSGDVYDLDEEQWKIIDSGISFYRSVSSIIWKGTTYFFGSKLKSYRNPKGWMGVIRKAEDEKSALALIYTFHRDFPDMIEIPVGGNYEIYSTYSTFDNSVLYKNGTLCVDVKQEFEAIAVYLKLSEK